MFIRLSSPPTSPYSVHGVAVLNKLQAIKKFTVPGKDGPATNLLSELPEPDSKLNPVWENGLCGNALRVLMRLDMAVALLRNANRVIFRNKGGALECAAKDLGSLADNPCWR